MRSGTHTRSRLDPTSWLAATCRSRDPARKGCCRRRGRTAITELAQCTPTDLLGQNVKAKLAGMPETDTTLDLNQMALDTGTYDVLAHRMENQLVVELEPALASPSMATTVLSILDAAGTSFERAANLRELCERAAVWFRKLTGYDRVMVYRFLDDDAGVVLAENRDSRGRRRCPPWERRLLGRL